MSHDVLLREISRLHTLSVSWVDGAHFCPSKTGHYIRQDPDGSLHVLGLQKGDSCFSWPDSYFIGPIRDGIPVTHHGEFVTSA